MSAVLLAHWNDDQADFQARTIVLSSSTTPLRLFVDPSDRTLQPEQV